MAIDIVVNGAPFAMAPGQSVHDLVVALELSGTAMAVAVNREVVPRQAWPSRLLQTRDRVDIVRAIGGG